MRHATYMWILDIAHALILHTPHYTCVYIHMFTDLYVCMLSVEYDMLDMWILDIAHIHVDETCYKCGYIVSRIWIMSYIWMSPVTYMDVCAILMTMRMRHAACVNTWYCTHPRGWDTSCHIFESCHIYEWDVSYTWMRCVIHMIETCHIYEWVMSYIDVVYMRCRGAHPRGWDMLRGGYD